MPLIIAAALIIGTLAGTVLLVVAVPAVIALMAYDILESRKVARPQPAPMTEPETEKAAGRIFLERGIARAFVIVGGLFWAAAIFAGLYWWRETGAAYALLGAFIPLMAILVTLVIGWYYERVVSALLVLATAAVVAWGVINGFETGVWIIVTFALIGPMLTAAVLFWLARREQDAMELALTRQLEVVPVTSTTSPLS